MNAWVRWNLSRLAVRAAQGWFYTDAGNYRILVHPNQDCTRTDCPQYGTAHRHVATPEQREEMYDCVTDWLCAEFECEDERRFEQESIAECYRILALDDPRYDLPCLDGDAERRGVEELERMVGIEPR